MCSHWGVGNAQLGGGCFGHGFFLLFNPAAVHSQPQNVTIPFLAACPAHVTFPKGGREPGSPSLHRPTPTGTKQRLFQGLRPLFVCLTRGEPLAACVLWEECGIPAFLRYRIVSTSHDNSKGSKQVLVLVVKSVLYFIIQLERVFTFSTESGRTALCAGGRWCFTAGSSE